MTRPEVIGFLKDQTELELIDIFYEVFNYKKRSEEGGGYCVAQCSFEPGDLESTCELVGLPESKGRGFLVGYSQKEPLEQGACIRCKALVTSVSKRALCPVCGEMVECS